MEIKDTKILPNKKCTREIVNNDTLFNKLGLNNYYCIDLNDSAYPLGGFWDGSDSLYYLDQTFYFCPNGNRTSNCTNISSLKQFLGKEDKIYYNYYYPKLYFSPTNYNQPLQIEYINSYELMSANIIKTKQFFFTNAEISSNKGWIFDSITNSSLITFDNADSQLDYNSDDDLSNINKSSAIFITDIYLMKNYNKYSVSYMKVQDLAAQVGGFMKIMMVFFSIINFYHYKISRDLDVINKIFEFRKLDDKTNKVDDNKRDTLKKFIVKNTACNYIY